MKTFVARPSDIDRKWLLIDAENLVLGRLSVIIANYVRGKHKPSFTPSMDCGDNVVVINAEKVLLTGKKSDNKIHYWHTGYPGGIKSETYGQILESKKPQKALELAVKRMIPKGPLGRQQLSNCKIFSGSEHLHVAQNPKFIDISELNDKNVVR